MYVQYVYTYVKFTLLSNMFALSVCMYVCAYLNEAAFLICMYVCMYVSLNTFAEVYVLYCMYVANQYYGVLCRVVEMTLRMVWMAIMINT